MQQKCSKLDGNAVMEPWSPTRGHHASASTARQPKTRFNHNARTFVTLRARCPIPFMNGKDFAPMTQPYPPPDPYRQAHQPYQASQQHPSWPTPAPPQQPYVYGYPQQAHSQPAYPYPYPYPLQQARQPIHHWATWPAVTLAAIAVVIAETARVMDYQMILILGVISLPAAIAALVIAIRARHGWCIFFAAVAVLNSLYVLGMGFEAYDQYQDALDRLRATFDN